jgi:hypothetical protein
VRFSLLGTIGGKRSNMSDDGTGDGEDGDGGLSAWIDLTQQAVEQLDPKVRVCVCVCVNEREYIL